MRSLSLLLLVLLPTLGKTEDGIEHHKRPKRESLSRSKRRWVLSTIELEEEMEVDYPYKISKMYNDKTQGKNHAFKINVKDVEDLFTIDKETGDVYVHRKVDREKKEFYHIIFDVVNEENNAKIDKELSFDVEVKDINDNKPVFKNVVKKADVKENIPLDQFLPVSMDVTDDDKSGTVNSSIVMTVTKQNPAKPKIEIRNVVGGKHQLKHLGCFDYDKEKLYTLTIKACDEGNPPLCTEETAELNIIDRNSHRPKFKQGEYVAEAAEMKTLDEILRVAVDDKDTPNTDGWRAKYNFISGNEDGIYKITTDPKTNEGIISVIKGKNFEKTTLVKLQVEVENIEPLTMCKDEKLITDGKQLPPKDSVNIIVKMIDDNDAPIFQKYTVDVYQTEEKEPGEELYTPVVDDVDSSNFWFELVEDPANWVTIDKKTGKITTIEKMDRESPFVDEKNIYKIVIVAIDDGEPPATSNCTINVHLRDINDNTPTLLNKYVTFCANHDEKVMVSAKDADAEPFGGPFYFSLPNDESVTKLWKLDPSFGEQFGIAPQSRIQFENHTVPIVIEDRQNQATEEHLLVVMCECDETGVCNKYSQSQSTRLSGAAIGLIIAGFLGFLTALLFLLVCSCAKVFKPIDSVEGSQKLMKYNEEAGCTDLMHEPTVGVQTKGFASNTDVMYMGTTKNVEASLPYFNGMETITATNINSNLNRMESQWGKSYQRNTNGFSRQSTRSTNIRSTFQRSTLSDNVMNALEGTEFDNLRYSIDMHVAKNTENCSETNDMIKVYQDEGDNNSVFSQEEIVDNSWSDLKFLDSLGPQFKTLEKIIESSKTERSKL